MGSTYYTNPIKCAFSQQHSRKEQSGAKSHPLLQLHVAPDPQVPCPLQWFGQAALTNTTMVAHVKTSEKFDQFARARLNDRCFRACGKLCSIARVERAMFLCSNLLNFLVPLPKYFVAWMINLLLGFNLRILLFALHHAAWLYIPHIGPFQILERSPLERSVLRIYPSVPRKCNRRNCILKIYI